MTKESGRNTTVMPVNRRIALFIVSATTDLSFCSIMHISKSFIVIETLVDNEQPWRELERCLRSSVLCQSGCLFCVGLLPVLSGELSPS